VRALRERDRLQILLEVAEAAQRTTTITEIEQLLAGAAARLLENPNVRVGNRPPAPDEIGARIESDKGGPRWLIAESRRSRANAWRGAYGASDESLLRTVAALGAAAVENILLVQEVIHDARHDPLTGLANRRLVAERLEQELALAERSHRQFGVLFVDLDRFKSVNDRYSHAVGDVVLRNAAARLRRLCRAGDVVGRWGGEEFVVVVIAPDGVASINEVADRMVDAFRAPLAEHGGAAITVTASIGAACWPDDGTTVIDLMGAADRALYAAKSAGRNQAATTREVV
jgi:diguanylate cyclase (GGDEF)-like protein